MKVHPFAAIYPMIPADEMEALAADIAENGLLHPLEFARIDGEEVLIDGRNRLAACELAKVEPAFVEYQGPTDDDAIGAYILALNNNRRHMNQGQRALTHARLAPEGRKRGPNGGVSGHNGQNLEPSVTTLKRARVVLKWAPDLVDGVMAGEEPLASAYTEAARRKRVARDKAAREQAAQAAVAQRLAEETASEDEKVERDAAEMRALKAQWRAELRAECPELAEAEQSGVVTLEYAREEMQRRMEKRKSMCVTWKLCFEKLRQFHTGFSATFELENVAEYWHSVSNREEAAGNIGALTFMRDFCDQVLREFVENG